MDTNSIIITTLQAKEKEMEAQLSELRKFISDLVSQQTPPNSEMPINQTEKRKYNSDGRKSRAGGEAIDEIVDKMRSVGKFMLATDIAKVVGIEREKLSSILSLAAKHGKRDVVKYVPGMSKNFTVWGFKEWLAEDGKPLPLYMQ